MWVKILVLSFDKWVIMDKFLNPSKCVSTSGIHKGVSDKIYMRQLKSV